MREINERNMPSLGTKSGSAPSACRQESPEGVEDHARTMRYLVRTERDMFHQPEEGQWLERSEVESQAFKWMELDGYNEEETQMCWDAELLRVRRCVTTLLEMPFGAQR